jgi:hypothetical protein
MLQQQTIYFDKFLVSSPRPVGFYLSIMHIVGAILKKRPRTLCTLQRDTVGSRDICSQVFLKHKTFLLLLTPKYFFSDGLRFWLSYCRKKVLKHFYKPLLAELNVAV